MILTVSMMVRTSLSGLRLWMSQLCLRNISWLPGKAAQVCPWSLASLKKSWAAQSMSMSRLWRSWKRSPRMIILWTLVLVQ